MFFVDKDIVASVLDEKCERKVLAHDNDLMACHLYFKTGGIGKKHSHEHTQICYVISGRFEFDLNGDSRVITAGDSVYIPSDVEHGLICLEQGELIDIFTPERKDFL